MQIAPTGERAPVRSDAIVDGCAAEGQGSLSSVSEKNRDPAAAATHDDFMANVSIKRALRG